ncbi:MAG TPA: carboxypeptidase-like regulatory domain-containing protein, partial [Thermoanaerobaculia bacterium]
TGRGIAGAKVIAGNEANGGMQLAQHVSTNDDGDAVLPPLRDGELIVSVQAAKYASVEPQRFVVDDKRHELEIALQPLDTRAELRVVLPNGAPAADAEVWAFDAAMQPLWRGKASNDGVLELPDLTLGATLLLRHPQAASSVRATAGEDVWRLEPPAAPLTLTVDPSASIALWLDGVRLSGPALSFAAWSGPSASPDGRWTGRNLPPRELRVLAGNISSTVTYPW